MNSNLQIDNIQSFIKVAGNNITPWRLLLGRDVVHVDGRRGKVFLINPIGLQIGLELTTKKINNFKCQDNSTRELYSTNDLNKIYPPLLHEEITKLIQIKQKETITTEQINQNIEQPREEKQIIKRKKAQILEAEKQRQRVEKQKLEKQALLKNIKENFEQNFFNADNFYQSKCTEYISLNEYKAEKSNYVQSWLKQHLNSTADLEQATAIGAVEGHIQVVARAGSGKTFTLVNRALFLQKHCGVAPENILMLAFNREAAKEIQERLTTKLGNSTPHIMTFHALAYALVHPEESILFDEPNGGQSKSLAVQDDIINGYIHNKALDPVFYEEIRALMMAHFREDWERILLSENNKSSKKTQTLRYIRLLPYEGLDGRHYKSFGEKTIANFLFEHDIPYKYERNFWWNEINYRPDFTIGEKEGVVIEYFGLEGNSEYDIMSEQKRDYWQNNKNWNLLEFFPAEYEFIANQVFIATNGMISISRIVAAAVDPNRDEGRAFMLVDGVSLEKHPNFSTWKQRGEEIFQLNRNQRLKLKLLANPTLAELVRAVKHKRISQL